jgi:hypothetical protein
MSASLSPRIRRRRSQGIAPEMSFEEIRYSQIASPEGRQLRLKGHPAVYAWYRDLRVLQRHVGSPESFLMALDRLLEANLSATFQGKIGYLYQVSLVEKPSHLGSKSRKTLEVIASDENSRRALVNILEAATFLQAPLYVGKALNLRRRMNEHLDEKSPLIQRFYDAKIDISECVLRYRYLTDAEALDLLRPTSEEKNEDDFGSENHDAVATMVEELLTRLSPSAFVKRPG